MGICNNLKNQKSKVGFSQPKKEPEPSKNCKTITNASTPKAPLLTTLPKESKNGNVQKAQSKKPILQKQQPQTQPQKEIVQQQKPQPQLQKPIISINDSIEQLPEENFANLSNYILNALDNKQKCRKIELLSNPDAITSLNNYRCCKCQDILNQPYYCKICSKNYCFDCIYELDNNLIEKYNKCLSKCKNIDYEHNLDLFDELQQLSFKCKCGKTLKYSDFIIHYHTE